MLINCPRCGFSQPKDRYCANCGVDMDNFKPKPTSIVKKVLSSPFFHIFIIASLVVASVVIIKQRQKEDLQARIEFLKAGPVLVETQRNSPPQPQMEVSASADVQNAIANQGPSAPATTGESNPANGNETNNNSTSTTMTANSSPSATEASLRSRTAPMTSLKMTATYLEVDRMVLNTWIEETKNSGQQRAFEGVTMGPIAQISTKLRSPGVRVLQTIDRNLDPANPTQEWFLGTHQGADPENQMGFFASLVLSDFREGITRGDIEVQRAFRNPQDVTRVIERVSFGSPFELAPGTAYMMAGLLPRRYATPLPESANADPYLMIFKSDAFRTGQTEFTLVLQFATSRP